MKTTTLLIVAGAAFALSAVACIVLLATYAPGYPVHALFTEADIVAKLCMMAMAPAALLALAGGFSGVRVLALIGAGLAVALGVLGAAWVEMNVQAAIRAVGPVSFAVTAPSHAEALFCLACGFGVATLTLGTLRLRGR